MNNIIIIIVVLLLFLMYKKHTQISTFMNKPLIFLHIPKNAGTTFKIMYPHLLRKKHYESLPSPNEINIAIIRNPYDRFLSIFSHIKDRTKRKSATDLIEFNTPDDLIMAYYDINNRHHEKAYKLLYWDLKKFENRITNHRECCEEHGCIHWIPQSLYIQNSDDVEYLLKFENLDSDLKKLKVLPYVNMMHKNKSISKFTLTSLVKQFVDMMYKDDFALWEKAGL